MSFKLNWNIGRKRAKKPLSPMAQLMLGMLLAGVALIFMAVGAFSVVHQQIVLGRVVEVSGTIEGKDVVKKRSRSRKGGSSTTYSPVVNYTYTYQGKEYTGNRLTFVNMSSDQQWARRAIAKYTVGSTHPVYVDPVDPTWSCLSRAVSFLIYMFIVGPLALFCPAMGVALRHGLKWPKRRVWGFLAASWGLVGGTALSHYFAVADGPYRWPAIVTASVYLLVTVVLLVGWQRAASSGEGDEKVVPVDGETA